MAHIFRRQETWGSVQVAITSGTIAMVLDEYKIDALVSSDDAELSMSGGVAGDIAELAGPRMVEEAAQLSMMPVGSVAITSAGDLDLRCIMHAVTVDWDNRVFASDKTVRQITRDVLLRCEALGVEGLALPALGTGVAGFPAMSAAAIMLGAFNLHLKNPTSLRRVVFCLPDLVVYKAFKDVFVALHLAAVSRRALDEAGVGIDPAGLLHDSVMDLTIGTPEKTDSFRQRRELEVTLTEPTQPAPHKVSKRPALQTGIQDSSSRPVIDRRYVVLEELGRGGVGVVYLVWDLVLQRARAIKVLRDAIFDTPATMNMLKREASVALDLAHEGIVRIFHFEPWSDDVGPYLAMEYIPWPSAERWAADAGSAGLPLEAVVDVGMELCRALGYAHGRGILHGDIKPSNLFVDTAAEKAKLGDFGLGRLVGAGTGRAIQLATAGTPAYMAPEQRRSGGKLSRATDIYLLAATLWDLLTGHPPTPDDLDSGYGHDTDRLLGVLRQAMHVEPQARPADAIQFELMLTDAIRAA